MKKVIFCLQSLNMGGVEKALITLFSAMDLSKTEVTLALAVEGGVLTNEIPTECQIIKLPLEKSVVEDLTRGGAKASVKYFLKKGRIIVATKIAIKKIFGNNMAEIRYSFKKIKPLTEKYDVAVAYTMHSPFFVNYVSDKIIAERKCVFIHNDFFTTKFNIEKLKSLENFDNIYAVSKQLKNEFITKKPNMSNKVEVFHNVVDSVSILTKGDEFLPVEFNSNVVNILSVGRLNPQKGFDMAIEVAKMLKDDKLNFCWYIVGGGKEEGLLKSLIAKNDVENYFVLLGEKMNPYSYMKNCDIYAQPSRHEGYCTTTNECKLFNKPIITTNVSGADEQFVNGENGIICDTNVESIYTAVKSLIINKDLQKKFSEKLVSENKKVENLMLENWLNSLK